MGSHDRERESHAREFDLIETTGLRARLGAAIEALVDLMDSLEPDPDLESAGDELDASYPEGWRTCDEPHEDAEDSGDGEPWLGWVSNGEGAHRLLGTPLDPLDCEDGDDPREFSWHEAEDQSRLNCPATFEDDEPSLGSTGPHVGMPSIDRYTPLVSPPPGTGRQYRDDGGSQEHWGDDGRGVAWSVTDAEEDIDTTEDDILDHGEDEFDGREIEHEGGDEDIHICG